MPKLPLSAFLKQTLLTPEEYQHHVLSIAQKLFPAEHVEITPDPAVILWDNHTLGLSTLYSEYTRDQLPPDERDNAIAAHLSLIMGTLRSSPDITTMAWPDVEAQLRLQFFPTSFRSQAPRPLVGYPFASGIEIGVVADLPTSYVYARSEDLARWEMTPEALYERALHNLEEATQGIEMHGTDAPERSLIIATSDGYDAVRLLVPGLRAFAAARLGQPCLAAIPNRDFLILWSTSNSAAFHQRIREQVRSDVKEQPHALTSQIFIVTPDKVVPEE
jgi:hypothetical protein